MRLDRKIAFCTALMLAVSAGSVFAQAQSEVPPKAAENCAELLEVMAKVEAQSRKLQDWPDLARYREANASWVAPAKGERPVVFMGDSITDKWALPRFGGFFPGKPYVDRGISGQTTPQMLVRFRADVIALQPKVVVILAGTNDLAWNTGPITVEETEGNLASMAELARANGIRVVLASVLPVSNYGHDASGNPLDMRTKRPPEKILELNASIKKICGGERSHISRLFFGHGGRPRAAQERIKRGWTASERGWIRGYGAAGGEGDCISAERKIGAY